MELLSLKRKSKRKEENAEVHVDGARTKNRMVMTRRNDKA